MYNLDGFWGRCEALEGEIEAAISMVEDERRKSAFEKWYQLADSMAN